MSLRRARQRIRDAGESVSGQESIQERMDVYMNTLEELDDLTPEDDDEGVTVVTQWIVDRMAERDEYPRSVDVRDRAAQYCRENGYEVPDGSWLVT